MFSERLKTLRIEKSLTQNQLAQELGLSNKTISVYEKGASSPTLDTLEKIAAYFDVTVDYLIGYSDERNPKNSQLSKELHLTQDAISKIKQINEIKNTNTNESLSLTLSKVITNYDFVEFLKTLSTFASYTEKDWNAFRDSFESSIIKDIDNPNPNKFVLNSDLMKSIIRGQLVKNIEAIIDTFIKPPTTE